MLCQLYYIIPKTGLLDVLYVIKLYQNFIM